MRAGSSRGVGVVCSGKSGFLRSGEPLHLRHQEVGGFVLLCLGLECWGSGRVFVLFLSDIGPRFCYQI